MAVSLKIILHSKKYTDGSQPVMLQCIVDAPAGKVWKRKTLCRVQARQFSKKTGRVKETHPNYRVLNETISQAYRQAEQRLHEYQQQNRPIDPAAILSEEDLLAKRGMLLAHGLSYIERCQLKGQIHTAEKYLSHVRRLGEFLGNTEDWDTRPGYKDISMDQVTDGWVLKFADWLRRNGTKSANTLHRRMAFLTTLFNDARRRGLTKSDPMQFLEFKEQRVRKPKLTVEQVKAMEELPLTGRESDARNTWLLQFYAYGSRISDAVLWKKADVSRQADGVYLEFRTMKTGDLISVRLAPAAVALVNYYLEATVGEYLLPWLSGKTVNPALSDADQRKWLIERVESATAYINKLLKAVASKAGINFNLTTHIARHTFATLADQRVIDKRKISAALSHSKFSTTEVYLADLRQGDINDAMDEIWK